MANVLVSPGVMTTEIDGTIRPADPQGVGPVFIGPRAKGPAMMPIRTKDLDEDFKVFGPAKNALDYVAYTNRAYLKQEATPSTVVRTLGLSDTGVTPGFSVNNVYAIGASGSSVIALIYSSGTVTLEGTLTSSASELAINVQSFNSDVALTCSLNRNDSKFIGKVLNTDPTQYSTKNHYVYAIYDHASKSPSSNNAFFSAQVGASAGTNTEGYITGASTVVISQEFDSIEYDLFGVGSIYAGNSANTEIKVSVTNIKKSTNSDVNEYGSFALVVREFYDNDRSPRVLETFSNLSLNPDDKNYVCKRVGDRYRVWNTTNKKFDDVGDYPNKSQYIYIIPSTDLKNGAVPGTALPYGFKGYRVPTSGAVSDKAPWPSLPYVSDMTYKSNFTTKVHWGVEVIKNLSGSVNYGVPDRLLHLSNALLAASGTTDSNFSLKNLTGATANVSGYSSTTRFSENDISAMSTSIQYVSAGPSAALTLDNIENTALAKFTFPIADGFDGLNHHLENPFDPNDMSSTTAYQTYAMRTAVDMVSNPDEFDLNAVAIPGCWATNVTDYTIEKVEDRGDMFYMMDVSGSTVDDVVSNVTTNQYDSNYAACWYPWVRMVDEVSDKIVSVPPTVVMPAVLAFNDKVAYPWFAPAGLNRGGLRNFGVTEAIDKLNRSDRDKLYENRVNPIATMTQAGAVVWGQKTLQVAASALDRINVRRMMLTVRKRIAREALNIVFEPNVPRTWERFVNRVQPYLDRVRENAGIVDFRLILDERTTTEDLIERNILYGKIAIKPSRAAEYVLLDFFITNNVAGFAE